MTENQDKVRKLIKDSRIAMLTTLDPQGRIVSQPMATQDVEPDADLWFIAERASEKVTNIARDPRVNVSYSSNDSWVSVAGTAEVVNDVDKLKELWNTFTDAWMQGGPENPENVLIRVSADSAEYWDSPGSKVTQVLNLLKAKVTGERYEGDNKTVDL
ncbi:MAG TPA: pyridoxamine 5'-phosphate oxidase family protein [Nocardioidaceae bacterium]|nr:pyridoxamine 5'-phosphate oxidase family protein [Nocardioidaceae bacterium]